MLTYTANSCTGGMRYICTLISVMICWAAFSVAAPAQEPGDDLPEWATFHYPQAWISASAGIGAGAGYGTVGSAGAAIQAGLPWPGLVGQVAFNASWPLHRFAGIASSLNVAAGTVRTGRNEAVVVLAGPSLEWGTSPDGRRYAVPGITLNTQLLALPSMLGGFGVEFVGTLSPERATMGVRFLLLIGSPRPSTIR